jgi:hypothetical protein
MKSLFAMILAGIVLANSAVTQEVGLTKKPMDFKKTEVARLSGWKGMANRNVMMSSDHRFVNGTVMYVSVEPIDYGYLFTDGKSRTARDISLDLNGDGISDSSVAVFGDEVHNLAKVGSDIILERSLQSIAKENTQNGAVPQIVSGPSIPAEGEQFVPNVIDSSFLLFDGTIAYIDGIPVEGQKMDYVQDFIDYGAAIEQYYNSQQDKDDYQAYCQSVKQSIERGDSLPRQEGGKEWDEYSALIKQRINAIMEANRQKQD